MLPAVAVVAVALNGLINWLNLWRQGQRLREPRLTVGMLAVPLLVPMGLSLVLLAGVGLVLSAMQYIWWIMLYGRRWNPG
jgi:hypothetical protein